MHVRVLYALAMALTLFAVFVLWVWTGPVGVILAAALTHLLLRYGETPRDAERALARKTADEDLRRAFDRR
jgi:Flp pilus assembly protein TadB